MKPLAAFLLLCAFSLPVAAEEASKGCAPVYGTWRLAYVMDKFGNPQPEKPPAGIIWEVRIDEDTATAMFHNGSKIKFSRWYGYRQNEYKFDGLAQSGEYLGMGTDHDSVLEYPSDKCYLDVWYSRKAGDIGSLRQRSLMERIE